MLVLPLLAIAPPAVAVLLLAGRVRPQVAAVVALAAGLAVLPAFTPDWAAVWRAQGVATATGLEVAMIIFSGLWLHEMMERTGAGGRLASWILTVTDDIGRRVLLVVLGITPFVESVTGFGVGAIVAFPLLRRMGFEQTRAAALALLGFVTVPWGALAPGTLIAARLTGNSFHDLGVESAILSLPVYLALGGTALVLSQGWRCSARRVPELVTVAFALWGGIFAANVLVGTAVAGAMGSLGSVAAVLILARAIEHRWPRRDVATLRAARPYALLVALLLAAQVSAAAAAAAGLEFTGAGAPIHAVWTSAASCLIITCLLAPAMLRMSWADARSAGSQASARWRPVAVTTLVFLSLGALITSGGMADALADAAAGLGRAFGAIVPWLGALGGFLTGSNAGANAMFAGAQAAAADRLGMDVLTVLAVQNVAASVATAVSPSRISLVAGLMDVTDGERPRVWPVLLAIVAALVCLTLWALAGTWLTSM
jgi:lactate permease